MNEVFKTEDTELPSCEWSNKLPFLAPNQNKNDYNSLSQTFQPVSCKKTFIQSICAAQLSKHSPSHHVQQSPPFPCACPTRSTPTSLPGKAVVQHILLHFASYTFLCSPTSPQFQQLTGRYPRSLWWQPQLHSGSPSPALPSLVSHLQGHHFLKKLHFTSRSRDQLLVWVQSQETLWCMGEGSWCIFCFMWPAYQKLH